MESRSLRDEAYSKIREMVMTGILKPGDRLAEPALAKILNISRTPVREAIGRMVSEGLAEYAQQHGAYVRKFDKAGVQDFYEVRELVETYSIRKIAERSDMAAVSKIKETVEGLRAVYEEFRGSKPNREKQATLKLAATAHDIRFHSTIVENSGNSFLVKMASEFNIINNIVILRRTHPSLDKLGEYFKGMLDVHFEIFNSVEKKAPGEAASLLGAHISKAKFEVMQEFDTDEANEGSSLASEIKKIISTINI